MRPAVKVARIAGASRHSRLETEPTLRATVVEVESAPTSATSRATPYVQNLPLCVQLRGNVARNDASCVRAFIPSFNVVSLFLE